MVPPGQMQNAGKPNQGYSLEAPSGDEDGGEMPAAVSLLRSDSKFDLAEAEPGVLQWLSF